MNHCGTEHCFPLNPQTPVLFTWQPGCYFTGRGAHQRDQAGKDEITRSHRGRAGKNHNPPHSSGAGPSLFKDAKPLGGEKATVGSDGHLRWVLAPDRDDEALSSPRPGAILLPKGGQQPARPSTASRRWALAERVRAHPSGGDGPPLQSSVSVSRLCRPTARPRGPRLTRTQPFTARKAQTFKRWRSQTACLPRLSGSGWGCLTAVGLPAEQSSTEGRPASHKQQAT